MTSGGDDPVDEPETQSGCAVDLVQAEQDDLLGVLGADEPWQKHSDDARAEFQLGLAENCAFRGNRKIARQGDLERARQAWSVDRRDGRVRAAPEAHGRAEVEIEDL